MRRVGAATHASGTLALATAVHAGARVCLDPGPRRPAAPWAGMSVNFSLASTVVFRPGSKPVAPSSPSTVAPPPPEHAWPFVQLALGGGGAGSSGGGDGGHLRGRGPSVDFPMDGAASAAAVPKITIPDTEEVVKDGSSKAVTFYRVCLDGAYRVSVRFSQFEKLHSQLRQEQSGRLAKFPPKRYSLRKRTTAEVEQRRLELQQYLQALVELPNVLSSVTFQQFLAGWKFKVSQTVRDKIFGLLAMEPCGMTAGQLERAFDRLATRRHDRLHPTVQRHGYVGTDARSRFLIEGVGLNHTTMRTRGGLTSTILLLPARAKAEKLLASSTDSDASSDTADPPERWTRKQVAHFLSRGHASSRLLKQLKLLEADGVVRPHHTPHHPPHHTPHQHQHQYSYGPPHHHPQPRGPSAAAPLYTAKDIATARQALGLPLRADDPLVPPTPRPPQGSTTAGGKSVGAEPCKFSRFPGSYVGFSNQQQDGPYIKAERLTRLAYELLYNPLTESYGTVCHLSEPELLARLREVCKIVDSRLGEGYLMGAPGSRQHFVLIVGCNRYDFTVEYFSEVDDAANGVGDPEHVRAADDAAAGATPAGGDAAPGQPGCRLLRVCHGNRVVWPEVPGGCEAPHVLVPATSSSAPGGSQHHRRLEILWDMENLHCPPSNPRAFVSRIKDYLASEGLLHRKSSRVRITTWIQHRAPCASVDTLQQLEFLGVRILTTFRRKKEVVDHCISGRLHEITAERPPESTTIVVLSSDFDFQHHLAVARDLGFRTVLIHDSKIYSTGKRHGAYHGYADAVDHMYLLTASPTGCELVPSPEPGLGAHNAVFGGDLSLTASSTSLAAAAQALGPAPSLDLPQLPLANDVITVKANLVNLTITTPRLELCQLPRRYAEAFSERLDHRALGYRRLKELVDECDDAISVVLGGAKGRTQLLVASPAAAGEPAAGRSDSDGGSSSGSNSPPLPSPAPSAGVGDTWDFLQPGHSTTWIPPVLVVEPPMSPTRLSRSSSVGSLQEEASRSRVTLLNATGPVATDFAAFLAAVPDDDPFAFQQWLVMKRFNAVPHVLAHLLGLCASEGRLNMARCLVFRLHTDINRTYGADGFSALHHACFRGRSKTAAALLRMGARPATEDRFGRTPRVAALQGGHEHCANLVGNTAVDVARERRAYCVGEQVSWSGAIDAYLQRYPALFPSTPKKRGAHQPINSVEIQISECGHDHLRAFSIAPSDCEAHGESEDPAGLGHLIWRLVLRDISKLQADRHLCFKILCDLLSVCFPPDARQGLANGSQFASRGSSTTILRLLDPGFRKELTLCADAVTKTCRLSLAPLPADFVSVAGAAEPNGDGTTNAVAAAAASAAASPCRTPPRQSSPPRAQPTRASPPPATRSPGQSPLGPRRGVPASLAGPMLADAMFGRLGSAPLDLAPSASPATKPLWTRRQVAKFFGMSPSAPKRYEARGLVTPVRRRMSVLYTTDCIDKIREQRVLHGHGVPSEQYPVLILPPTSPLLAAAIPQGPGGGGGGGGGMPASQAKGVFFDWLSTGDAPSPQVRVFVPSTLSDG